MQLSQPASFLRIGTSDYWQTMQGVYINTKGCANKINEVEKMEFQINDQPPILNIQILIQEFQLILSSPQETLILFLVSL